MAYFFLTEWKLECRVTLAALSDSLLDLGMITQQFEMALFGTDTVVSPHPKSSLVMLTMNLNFLLLA